MNDRITQLEQQARRHACLIRAQFVGLILCMGIMLCASVPPLHAQVLSVIEAAAGWRLHRDGRATFNSDEHLTGANVDIVGDRNADSGLGVYRRLTTPADPVNESFFIFGHETPAGDIQKDVSFSTHWAQRPFAGYEDDPTMIMRLFTTYQGLDKAKAAENIGLMQCGGSGTVFYPDNGTNAAECPGPNTVLFNRDVSVNKDVHIKGRLFVNGVEVH